LENLIKFKKEQLHDTLEIENESCIIQQAVNADNKLFSHNTNKCTLDTQTYSLILLVHVSASLRTSSGSLHQNLKLIKVRYITKVIRILQHSCNWCQRVGF